MTRKEYMAALKATADAAKAEDRASNQAFKDGRFREYMSSDEFKTLRGATEMKIGRFTIKASTGGNTVRHHVRHTFKLDGRRIARAKVEKMLEEK